MAEQSPEDRAKIERATNVLMTDKLQLLAQRDAVAWLVPQTELGFYLIGLASGELRWLPNNVVENDLQPPQEANIIRATPPEPPQPPVDDVATVQPDVD